MDERVSKSEYMVFIMGVVVLIEHLQDCNLHHALVEICGLVFDDLDGDNLVRPSVLALDDLAKRALTEHVEDEVSVQI